MRHILVTGSHCSGTTWVGEILGYLPRIDYVHEPFNVEERFSDPSVKYNVGTWFLYAPGFSDEERLRAAFDRRFRRSRNPWLSAYDVCEASGLSSIGTPLRFAKHFLLRTLHSHRVLVKDPIALLSASWFHEQFGMDVICMIRNPVAFVGSIKKQGWTFDFRTFTRQERLIDERLAPYADKIFEYASSQKDLVDQACLLWNCLYHVVCQYQSEHSDWCYISHEELAANPVEGFGVICDRLAIKLPAQAISKINALSSPDAPVEQESPTSLRRNSRGSLETWRKRLTPDEVDRVIEDTAECASRLYRINGDRFEPHESISITGRLQTPVESSALLRLPETLRSKTAVGRS